MNFWLFLLAAFLCVLYALWTRLTVWMFLAALLYGPFAMFLYANTNLGWLGLVAWAIFAGAPFALRAGRRELAAVLPIPALFLAAFMAWQTFATGRPGAP
jgi:hypothetical protein